jgi:hypothetical protein
MRTLKTGILAILCCIVLNSEFVFADRCSTIYRDKSTKTIGDLVIKQACALGISGSAAICAATAVTVTIITAGAAVPITLPITIASATVALTKSAYDAYPLLGSVERLRNNHKVDQLLVDAYTLSMNRKARPKTLSEFYAQQYGDSDKNQKVPTLRDVALHLIRMDVAQSLCTVGDLPYGEGRFFAYLPLESIMKEEKLFRY